MKHKPGIISRDVTEYKYIIWIQQIICSKQIQIQKDLGGALFVCLFVKFARKVERVICVRVEILDTKSHESRRFLLSCRHKRAVRYEAQIKTISLTKTCARP